MSKVKILQYGSPVLEEKAKEVTDPTSVEIQELIKKMFDALEDHKRSGAGIAAPQIGIGKRIAIIRRMDLEEKNKNQKRKWEIIINPVIKSKSKETSTEWEGCLSINSGKLFGEVTRPKIVEIEYIDEKGTKKSLKADGYFSHVIQHEMDHLDGILFLKYIKDPSDLYTQEELRNK